MDTNVVSDDALPSQLAPADPSGIFGNFALQEVPKKICGLAQDEHGRALARRQRVDFGPEGPSAYNERRSRAAWEAYFRMGLLSGLMSVFCYAQPHRPPRARMRKGARLQASIRPSAGWQNQNRRFRLRGRPAVTLGATARQQVELLLGLWRIA